jgi:hypothetical protein
MTLRGLQAQLVAHMRTDHVWYAKGLLTDSLVWKHKSGQRYGKTYLAETVGRALRRLEEQRVVAVKPDGISVQYKWLPPERRGSYIPWSSRVAGQKNVLFSK